VQPLLIVVPLLHFPCLCCSHFMVHMYPDLAAPTTRQYPCGELHHSDVHPTADCLNLASKRQLKMLWCVLVGALSKAKCPMLHSQRHNLSTI
jgi:hypothetical protein